MLKWTESGAVSWPKTLQIRISKRYENRIKANAPTPSRHLSLQEIEENLYYFRHTLETPRTQYCTSLTLSGLQEASRETVFSIGKILQRFDFQYIRAHIDTQSMHLLPDLDFVHHISITLHNEILTTIPHHLLPKIQYSISLTKDNLSHINGIISTLQAIYSFPITLIYPFPLREDIVHNAPAMQTVQEILEKIPPNIPIVGIPRCLSRRSASKKTSNRWYIDADHQKEKALLFFPDLLRYYKSDECRFCTMNTNCNGFFSQYLNKDVQLSPLLQIDDSIPK